MFVHIRCHLCISGAQISSYLRYFFRRCWLVRSSAINSLGQTLTLTNPVAEAIPRTYIHCVEETTAEEIAAEEARFDSLGWQYHHLPTGHDAMITMPEELSKILLELA